VAARLACDIENIRQARAPCQIDPPDPLGLFIDGQVNGCTTGLRANFWPRAANASDAVRPPAGRREIFRRSFDPSLQRRLSHIRAARNAQSSIDQRVPSVIWRRAGDRRADLELPPRGDCRRIRPKIGDRIEAKSLLCPISPVAPVTRAACDRRVRAHKRQAD